MGCLCFVRRPPSARASPYADLMAPGQWAAAAREFSRQCCGLLGQVGPLLSSAVASLRQGLHAARRLSHAVPVTPSVIYSALPMFSLCSVVLSAVRCGVFLHVRFAKWQNIIMV